jgi:uncharacterized membrane protein YdjX (TVP38/TMEM64 family)
LIIRLPPCIPLSLLSTASTLWWRSCRRYIILYQLCELCITDWYAK